MVQALNWFDKDKNSKSSSMFYLPTPIPSRATQSAAPAPLQPLRQSTGLNNPAPVLAPMPQVRQAPMQPLQALASFGQQLVAGTQQGVGALGDVALGGGQLVDYLGKRTRGMSDGEAAISSTANTKKYRDILNSLKDIQGNAIVGTTDVDENATRIASGQGDLQDFAAVAGKGLEVGNTATMFANPTKLLTGAPIQQLVKTAAKDAALFGATGGAEAGLQTFGETGDLAESAKAAAVNAALSAVTQGGLDIAAPILGKGVRKTVDNFNEAQANFDPRAGFAKIPGAKADDVSKAVDAQIYASNPELFETLPTQNTFGENGESLPRLHTEDLKRYFGNTENIPNKYKRTTGDQDIDLLAQRAGFDDVDKFVEAIQGELSTRSTIRENKQRLAELRSDPSLIEQAKKSVEAEKSYYGDTSVEPKISNKDWKEYLKATDIAEIGSPKALAPRAKAVVAKPIPAENLGVAKTGEKAKSTAKASKGRTYEKTSVAASKGRGSIEAEKTNYEKFIKSVSTTDVPTAKQADTARALQSKYEVGSAEHKALGKIVGKNVTESAQTLATIDREVRKKGTAQQITDKFANKLYTVLDDDRTLNKDAFKKVEEKNRVFESARNAREDLYNRFQADPSDANYKAYSEATQAFRKADVDAAFEEYNTVGKAIKDSKTRNTDAKAYLETLKRNSGIYTMDFVDTNLLSSTRVMINNYINSVGVGLEEAAFGKVGAALARKVVPDAKIGGGSIAGRKLGKKIGTEGTITEAKLRQGAYDNPILKTFSNVITTGNTLGDREITGAAYSMVYDVYRQELKAKGYTGKDLDRRAKVETLADTQDRVSEAKQQVLADVGLAGAADGKTKKFESQLADTIAKKLGNTKAAQVASKTAIRTLLGFPTVVVRGAIGGARRSTLGAVSGIQLLANLAVKGDPQLRAKYIKAGIKEAGSGAVMTSMGVALGSTGLISGAYPSKENQEERDQWAREGKTAHSIKIGKDWYNLPQALGVFALPFMIGANAAENAREGKAITEDIFSSSWDTLLELSPTSQFQDTIKLLNREADYKIPQYAASVARSVTPLGGLLNQVAKAFDPTANDTTQGTALDQFFSKVRDGIPFANAGLPDKEVEGNVITNPNPIARMLGAVSTEQDAGVKATEDMKATVVAANKQMDENGIFTDNIRGLLDDETKVLFDGAKSGKTVSAEDNKKLLAAVTKNVNKSDDTRFLEDGKYDENIAVLKTKLSMVESDPTTRKETIEDYKKQITRGEVYKANSVPYDVIKKYSETGVEDWRKMGIAPGQKGYDEAVYNPELYQTLYNLDSKLTEAGVSRNSKDNAKNKYAQKTTASGGSGGGSGGSSAASNKASANAVLNATKDTPTAKLPNAPKVTKATYKRVPTSGASAARKSYAPIRVSAKRTKARKS